MPATQVLPSGSFSAEREAEGCGLGAGPGAVHRSGASFLTSLLAATCWEGTWVSVVWAEASPGAFGLPLGPREPAGSPSPWRRGSRAVGLCTGRAVWVRSYFYLCIFRKFFITVGAGSLRPDGVGRDVGAEEMWLKLV